MELKDKIPDLKNSINEFNRKQKKISKHKDKYFEFIQSKEQKKMNKGSKIFKGLIRYQ